jgi:hypothetical protein
MCVRLHRNLSNNTPEGRRTYLGLFHPQHLISTWERVLDECKPIYFPSLDSIPMANHVNIRPPPYEKDPNFTKKPKPKKSAPAKPSKSKVSRRMLSELKGAEAPTQNQKFGRKPKVVKTTSE